MRFEFLSQIADCLDLRCENKEIHGFSIDSRMVKKGDLFFALKGEKYDGHDYLKQVAAKGSLAAVVDGGYRGESCGLILLRVDNVLEALQKLAKNLQSRRKQRIIAVTGSVGKTTTKDFIATLLSHKYSVAKTPGNSNSQVGLPLGILNASGKEEYFVIEMGMTQEGQIKRLVDIAPPEVAVVTKIGHAHIEFFPDGLEGIARAKAEIFSHPDTTCGIVDALALQYTSFRECRCPLKTFSLSEKADFVWQGGRISESEDESPLLRLPFSEKQFYEDFLAAAAVGKIMGLSWEEIVRGLPKLKTFEKRFEKIEREGALIINDCYNANPESVKAALENLPQPSFGGKTIGVLGEMADLGSYSEEWHRKIGNIALGKVDHLLCFGKESIPMVEVFNTAGKPAELFHNLRDLRLVLFDLSKPGDVILVKGKNSNKLWQILE